MADKPGDRESKVSTEKRAPIIAGFELLKRVGRGGMGTVYRARQISVDRTVAVKILKPSLAQNRSFIRRFKEEAKAAAKLNHPKIVQAIDAGEEGGHYYFAMEFVDGETLHRRMLREGVIQEPEALRMALDVARAMGHAFEHGIVHRDIKPGNIMISHNNETKLCDLGLARLLAEEDPQGDRGAAVGTPYYISPEQAMGAANADCRSDIYSLGATLFRALVGRPVFNAPTPAEILEQHVHAPVPWPKDYNPELSEHVCYVLVRMLAKKQGERYQTPMELAEDIERVLAGEEPKSTLAELELPPQRLPEQERAADVMTSARLRKKKEAVRQLAKVRTLIDKVGHEESLPSHAVVRLLRGNLDESKAGTFLKYGIILLTERKFAMARKEFRMAQRLGADVSQFLSKLDALGAPPGMVYVPAGEFKVGPPDDRKTLNLDAFYIDVNLITNQKYHGFMRATGAQAPHHWIGNNIPDGRENFPVVDITWEEARAYSEWARKRLPTVAEWQKAACGYDGRRYPWGNEFDPLRCNVAESGHDALTEAGRYPRGRSPFGCFDMFGNVVQFCQDAGLVSGETMEDRPVCGVSFNESGAETGCWEMRLRKLLRRSRRCGFRCAMNL